VKGIGVVARLSVVIFPLMLMQLALSLCFSSTALAAPNDQVLFGNNDLKNCILNQATHANPSYITEAEAATVTAIDCRNFSISNLVGLEKFINLESLTLISTTFTDLTPIENLTELSSIIIVINDNLRDLTPLGNLPQLESLSLVGLKLTDLTAVGDMTNLRNINLRYMTVDTISSLARIPNLDTVGLSGTSFGAVSQLKNLPNLRDLSIDENGYTAADLAVLADPHFNNLRSLNLNMNQLESVSMLRNMINLDTLYLGGNRITDISPLASIVNLTQLDLTNNYIEFTSTPVNIAQANPLRSVDGSVIVPTGMGFTYDTFTHSWKYDTIGSQSLDWLQSVTVGSLTVDFSGSFVQESTDAVFIVPTTPGAIGPIPTESKAISSKSLQGRVSAQQIISSYAQSNAANPVDKAATNLGTRDDTESLKEETTLDTPSSPASTPSQSPVSNQQYSWWWLLILLAAIVGISIYRYSRYKKR
jgi:hypothetical protein